jgi:hypothetical protein
LQITIYAQEKKRNRGLITKWPLINLLATIPAKRPIVAQLVAGLIRRHKNTALLRDGRIPWQSHLIDSIRSLEAVSAGAIVCALVLWHDRSFQSDTACRDITMVEVGIRIAGLDAVYGMARRRARDATCRTIVAFFASLDDAVSAHRFFLAILGTAARLDSLATGVAFLIIPWGENAVTTDTPALVGVHLADANKVHEARLFTGSHAYAVDAYQRWIVPVGSKCPFVVVHNRTGVIWSFKVPTGIVYRQEIATIASAVRRTLWLNAIRVNIYSLAVKVKVLVSVWTLVLMGHA